MTNLVIDLTDIIRIEFEVLRVKFPIEDGEPVPARDSVLNALLIHAGMLSLVLKDPAMKSKVGMEGIEAPRRHQRKIVAACMSLFRKLKHYRPDQYLLLMNLVGLSNRLFEEQGEPGVTKVYGIFNTPITVDPKFLVPSKPGNPNHHELAEAMDRFAKELQGASVPQAIDSRLPPGRGR